MPKVARLYIIICERKLNIYDLYGLKKQKRVYPDLIHPLGLCVGDG